VQHKIVVNVGYSPTFEGSENAEKIIEAHFLPASNNKINDVIDGSFYNEPVRMLLVGRVRPEVKFDDFGALVAQINDDVKVARTCLDEVPYAAMRADKFLVEPARHLGKYDEVAATWVGTGGGDGSASWEWEEARTAVKATPLGRFLL